MLPEDVGFKVGANSRIKYLVLQVHYINVETIDKGLLKKKYCFFIASLIIFFESAKCNQLSLIYRHFNSKRNSISTVKPRLNLLYLPSLGLVDTFLLSVRQGIEILIHRAHGLKMFSNN